MEKRLRVSNCEMKLVCPPPSNTVSGNHTRQPFSGQRLHVSPSPENESASLFGGGDMRQSLGGARV